MGSESFHADGDLCGAMRWAPSTLQLRGECRDGDGGKGAGTGLLGAEGLISGIFSMKYGLVF